MPMISLRDWVGAVSYLIESRDVSGAFNLCCPHTPDQRRVHQGAGGRAAPQGLPRRPGTVAEAGRRRPRTRGARLGQRPTGSTRAGRLRLRGRGRARGAGRRAVLIAHLLHHPPRALADQHHPSRRGSVDRQRHRRAGSDGLRTDHAVRDHQLQPARRPGGHAQAPAPASPSPRPGARAGRSPAAAGRRPPPRRTRRRTTSPALPRRPRPRRRTGARPRPPAPQPARTGRAAARTEKRPGTTPGSPGAGAAPGRAAPRRPRASPPPARRRRRSARGAVVAGPPRHPRRSPGRLQASSTGVRPSSLPASSEPETHGCRSV